MPTTKPTRQKPRAASSSRPSNQYEHASPEAGASPAEGAAIPPDMLYRLIVETIQDGIWVLDTHEKTTFVNQALTQMLGYSSAEMLNRPMSDFMDRVGNTLAHAMLKRGAGISERYEIKLLRKDGGELWAQVAANPLHDEQGRYTGTLGLIRDISEKKQAEQVGWINNERYRSLFGTMLNGLAYCKVLFEHGRPQDIICLEVNSAFETLTGLKNVVGKKVTELIPGIHESDVELFETYGRVALTGVPERFETYVKAMDMWFSISVYSPETEYFVAVFDVITERKRVETALSESETRFRAIFENSVDAIGVSKGNEHVMVNPALAAMFGFSDPDEVIGRPVSDLIAPGDRQKLADVLKRRKRGVLVGPAVHEIHGLRKDGTEFSMESRVSTYDLSGETYTVGIIRDITERKRAQEALQESENRFKRLAEATTEGIVIHDNGRVIDVNQSIVRMLGYEVSELIGRDALGIGTAPESRVTILQHMRSGTEQPYEAVAQRKDGSRFPVEIVGRNLPFNDQGLRVVAFRDITEQKVAEEQLKRHRDHLEQLVKERTTELRQTSDRITAILDSVGEAIMVVKPDGRIEQVNRAFEEHTGYASSEVEQRHHRDVLFDGAMPREVFEASTDAMRTGLGWRGEMPVRRKDGSRFDAAVTITTMFNARGERVAFVGILRDISALKDIERMKDTFVSNVSHELRTPITSIKLYLDLLDMKPEKHSHYVEILKRENSRLESLIEGLLRLSRLDQNRTAVKLSSLDLNDLVAEYVADRSPLAQNSHLKLAFEPDSTLPICDGDRSLLGQVLSIILTNALNYTPPGGDVRVNTQTRQVNGQVWVGFSVTDTGPGIDLEEAGKLFMRFFRGKAGLSSGIAGTGLGLAIAKEIVLLHHGQIEAFRNPLQAGGTIFRVWIPVEAPGN